MSVMNYDDRLKELRKTCKNDIKWGLLKDKEITLVVGAGVTSCLVGNWNDLLNELAVIRCVSEGRDVSPQQMLDFLNENCRGKFLPDDTDVLEKGEYLRFSPKDMGIYKEREKADSWIETVFADRVGYAVERLITKHLCDGGGKQFSPDYKADFLAWCRNTPQGPFDIGRRELSKNTKTEEYLEKMSAGEITGGLHSWYGISLDDTYLAKEIADGRGVEAATAMFGPLFKDRSDAAFRKKTSDILKDSSMEGKEAAEKARLFLIRISSYLLWRPSYETLETTLSLCARKKIRHVLTYNFDTIFERLLNDREVQVLLRGGTGKAHVPVCVYGIQDIKPLKFGDFSKKPDSQGIHIYHVHGIVDRELEKPERVIFSETSYHSYQEIKLNPGSMEIARAFYRGHLLCVGFSGSDANFRSVLRQRSLYASAPSFSKELKKNNHILMTRSLKEITDYYEIKKGMAEKNLEVAFSCAMTNLCMQENYYSKNHNITILWTQDFEDMTKQIKDAFGMP